MLEIFPTNGLDRSILTPVLIGLAYITFFTEVFGWPFVALVVPGYLSAVFIAAPVSGATIVLESLATYVIARAIGEWIPRLGAWTVFFGRDRFFLLIAVSVVVRLLSEGVLLPMAAMHFEFRHATELYSVGLVLVPLTANAFWNVGFGRGVFHSVTITLLTYVTVRFVLLPLTNLSLSRFELTYESVALDFLGTPKAYLLLLAGTIIAARSNLLYGWDYNGILVPGLLAVAWYSPTKLISTLIEAIVIARLTQLLVQHTPLGRKLIEGPRRVLLVFCVGFTSKMMLGYTAMALWPGAPVTDLYGFGYVLPTLIAVKIWQRQSVPRVVVPTVAVSLAGFVVGNALGFALGATMPTYAMDAARASQVEAAPSTAWELTLQSGWPLRPRANVDEDAATAIAVLAAEAHGGDVKRAIERCSALDLRVVRAPRAGGGQWWMVRRPKDRASTGAHLPAVAVSDDLSAKGIVVARGAAGSPAAILALDVAEATRAAMVLVIPPMAGIGADGWVTTLSRATRDSVIAVIEVKRNESARVDVSKMTAAQRARVVTTFSTARAPGDALELSSSFVSSHVARRLGSVRTLSSKGTLTAVVRQLSSTGRTPEAVTQTSPEQLRLFSATIAPAMLAWKQGVLPSAYVLAIANQLGFDMYTLQDGQREALSLASREGSAPLTWVSRRVGQGLVVQTRFADRSRGVYEIALALAELGDATHLLFGGDPDDTEDAAGGVDTASYHQRAHELLLAEETRVVELRAVPMHHEPAPASIVLSTGDVTAGGLGVPEWMAELSRAWGDAQLAPVWYDGSRALSPFRGAGDPALAYARRFSPNHMAIAWISRDVRARFDAREDARLEARLGRLRWASEQGVVVDALASRRRGPGACDLESMTNAVYRYRRSDNPAALLALRRDAQPCRGRVVRDESTGVPYMVMNDRQYVRALRLDRVGEAEPRLVRSVDEARRAVLGRISGITWERGL